MSISTFRAATVSCCWVRPAAASPRSSRRSAASCRRSRARCSWTASRSRGRGPIGMMVFQEFEQLLPWKTVRQNVMFPMRVTRRLPAREVGPRADAADREGGASPSSSTPIPHMLSGGMKLRVAIARALAMEPAHSADGRAVRRARCADPAQDAGRTAAAVGRSRASPCCSSPIRSRRRSWSASRILVLSPHPGRVRAELDAAFTLADIDGAGDLPPFERRIHDMLFGRNLTAAER